MNPLVAFNLALSIAEQLIPEIEKLVAKGEISIEEQQAARAKYEQLRAQGPLLFAGPQWQPSPLNDGQV